LAVLPRSRLALTAAASSLAPSEKVRPGRRWKVTERPSSAYVHDSARPGCTWPLASTSVIPSYTRASACTSLPIAEVAGSQVEGRNQPQVRVSPRWPVPLPLLTTAAWVAQRASTSAATPAVAALTSRVTLIGPTPRGRGPARGPPR